MRKTLISVKHAVNGLRFVFKEERNFKIELLIGTAILVVCYYFNFDYVEILFIVVSIIFVISAEIINTAIEDLCNKIEPNHDQVIKKIKDMMAGFVLVLTTGAVIVGIVVFYNHFI